MSNTYPTGTVVSITHNIRGRDGTLSEVKELLQAELLPDGPAFQNVGQLSAGAEYIMEFLKIQHPDLIDFPHFKFDPYTPGSIVEQGDAWMREIETTFGKELTIDPIPKGFTMPPMIVAWE